MMSLLARASPEVGHSYFCNMKPTPAPTRPRHSIVVLKYPDAPGILVSTSLVGP